MAQVKNYAANVTVAVEPMRQIVGVGAVQQKIPLFFTSGRYTYEALRFAEHAGIAAFHYSASAGWLNPGTAAAKEMKRLVQPDLGPNF